MKKRLPEILAPAGSPAALEAALACGADAVYLGVDALNARRNAENFTAEMLPELVRRCHIRGTKVYLTLNILLSDREFSLLSEIAGCACAAGVDAVILQDTGAAAVLRRCAPALRLHASTQMAVHNSDGARLLEELGFSRVVLARECSKQEISEIVSATSLEVEAFVHGAQCMCVSGQCYLSAVLGQRSGNRGLCAQPCRLPVSSGASGHALSLKDMSLIEQLSQVKETGVCSLKIEGRMKRPEYVAAAVTACRAALAGDLVEMDDLRSIFSRSGFTDGYFSGTHSIEMFGIREKEDVVAAAGVLGKLANLYNEPRRHVRKIGVDFSLQMQADAPATLSVRDCDGFTAVVTGETPQIAQNKPTDPQRAAESLGKTGATAYFPASIVCDIQPGLMLPAAAINALRRDALERLDHLRGAPCVIPFDAGAVPPLPDVNPKSDCHPALRVVAERADQLGARMLREARMIVLPPDELEQLLESGACTDVERLCVGTTRMQFGDRQAAQKQLARLRERGISHANVGNWGALRLAREQGFTLHADPFLNLLNSYAAQVLEQMGAASVTASWELTLEQTKRLRTRLPLGITAYGHLPLMTLRVCPGKVAGECAHCRAGKRVLTDRKGEQLRLSCAWGCAELYNPQPLYLADRLPELSGLDFITLRLTCEDARRADWVFGQYQGGAATFDGAFTRGLLYKPVL